MRLMILLWMLILCAPYAAAGPDGNTNPNSKPISEGRILVKPKAGLKEARMLEILARSGGAAVGIRQKLDKLGIRVVKVPRGRELEFVEKLRQRHEFEFAEPDYLVAPDESIPNDPRYGSQWHLPVIAGPVAWDSSSGAAITVAVLDTGVYAAHPDLEGRVLAGRNIPSSNGNTGDIMGHGTAVAGTIAAAGNNEVGIASVAYDARILPVRISDRTDGVASTSDMAAGLVWAADAGARVANLSYGVGHSATVQSAAKYLRNLGGLTFVAAGNDSRDTGWTNHPDLIVVSATDKTDSLAGFSNHGLFIDLAAPGDYIYSTTKSGGYGNWRGTSFASPVAAGVAALVMSVRPELGPQQVANIMASTAIDKGAEGPDPEYGAGRVDAGAAVSAATVENPGDTTDPTAVILSPADGSTVAGVVTVDVQAEDDQTVAMVELRVNGVAIATDIDPPYAFVWDTTGNPAGDYAVSAIARDLAGNTGTAAPVSVTIADEPGDEIGPEITFTSPTSGADVTGSVTISAYAVDENGVDRISIRAGGKLLCAGATNVSCGWNTRKIDAGSHTISAEAVDRAGNVSTASVDVNVTKSEKKRGGQGGGKGGGKGRNR